MNTGARNSAVNNVVSVTVLADVAWLAWGLAAKHGISPNSGRT